MTLTEHGSCGGPVYVNGPASQVTVVVDDALPIVRCCCCSPCVGITRVGRGGESRTGVRVVAVRDGEGLVEATRRR